MSAKNATSIVDMHPLMTAVALVCAAIAVATLAWFLLWRPHLSGELRVILLLAFAVFPIGATLTGNVAGMEHTKHREFCASCHVMTPYTSDSSDPTSITLAAKHARNESFGKKNCYECHRDYGMFSTMVTKWGGMGHVWEYYTKFSDVPADRAVKEFDLYEPFRNASCIRCHSTEITDWAEVADHRAAAKLIRRGSVSCVSRGCHGPAHPFSKSKRAGPRENQP